MLDEGSLGKRGMGVVVFGVWYMEARYALSSRGGCQVLDSLYNVINNIEELVGLGEYARVL